jgi:hypothetical protein
MNQVDYEVINGCLRYIRSHTNTESHNSNTRRGATVLTDPHPKTGV